MKVRKAKLTAMLLYHHFITGIELKCVRQHVIQPVMRTLNYHEMVGKINVFCQMLNIFKHKQSRKAVKAQCLNNLS